jgi:hypothetical protein
MENTEKVPFDSWCIIDLYGHQQIAGHVTEQAVAGQGFVRVDVPEMGDQPAYSRLFGPGAIYSIIPTTEPIARAFCARNVAAPIRPWQLTQPALPEPCEDFTDQEDGQERPF